MQIFKLRRLTSLIYISYLIITLLNCNQISSGQQRRKFEFLYKLNNHASLFREYTNGITYFNDLDFYEGRMKILYEDVNKVETVNGWGVSRVLKENFMKMIEDNTKTVEMLRQRNLLHSENIRKEYDVIIMNERADNFIDELQNEILKVGKE